MPRTTNAPLRLPPEFRKGRRPAAARRSVLQLMRDQCLSTVCEEARCPNIGECFSSGTATFMILGDRCTRRCHFCAVQTGRGRPLDGGEPEALAEAAQKMALKHVVITSVDRDDLKDKGSAHWAACIRAVKRALPAAKVEILTPDFQGDRAAIDVVLAAEPDVFNHNIETVERLYREVRPQSRWEVTTAVLRYVASTGHRAVKSGMMVGLGERDEEVMDTLVTLRELGVRIATVGQYLRPSLDHRQVDRYVDDASYERFRAARDELGFDFVFAGPFVRSSYNAAEALRAAEGASSERSSAL